MARTAQQANAYLSRFFSAVIVQKYIEGEEFGVFVACLPGASLPKILSIAHKTFPCVLGDGVSAERAHIYHPGTPLLDGYRAMFHQWSIAFEISTAYARSGVATTSAFQLLRQFRQDLRRSETWF